MKRPGECFGANCQSACDRESPVGFLDVKMCLPGLLLQLLLLATLSGWLCCAVFPQAHMAVGKIGSSWGPIFIVV